MGFVIYEAHHLSRSLLHYRNDGSYDRCDLEIEQGKVKSIFEFSQEVGIILRRPRKAEASGF